MTWIVIALMISAVLHAGTWLYIIWITSEFNRLATLVKDFIHHQSRLNVMENDQQTLLEQAVKLHNEQLGVLCTGVNAFNGHVNNLYTRVGIDAHT